MVQHDIAVIGGGPAGLAAALEAHKQGCRPIVIERENHPGGILKQCIHEGFGLHHFKEQLTGPEYTERFLKEFYEKELPMYTSTFVSDIRKEKEGYRLKLVNKEDGVFYCDVKAIILANGCRERSARQVFIHGHRPAGVLTAGTAQYYVNIMGYLPCKKCVVLGSGDIGLIMARRLTLEGAEVLGVYEVKDTPSGLTRNIVQCLDDFNIPLHLSKTVTKVHGKDRIEGVTVSSVDQQLQPIEGTEEHIECDGLILSVGLIPENELAENLDVLIDPATKGPVVNQFLMTNQPGIFSCGNALHVNDLVDYVTESGIKAGKSAVWYVRNQEECGTATRKKVNYGQEFLYVVPQTVQGSCWGDGVFYFRVKEQLENTWLKIRDRNGEILFEKKYLHLKPAEMERIQFHNGEDNPVYMSLESGDAS